MYTTTMTSYNECKYRTLAHIASLGWVSKRFIFVSTSSFGFFICISDNKSDYDDDAYFGAMSQNCKYVHQIQDDEYQKYYRVKHLYHKEIGHPIYKHLHMNICFYMMYNSYLTDIEVTHEDYR